MAEAVTEKPASASGQVPANSCCQVWIARCTKTKEMRNALRQALKLFEQQLDKIQADNVNLKKASEDERARAEVEKEGREKELAARISLETEMSALKSEISLLQQKGGSTAPDRSEEVKRLQTCVSEKDKEINWLKELLEKEKLKALSEKKNAEAEKKRATEAWACVKAEKSKTDEERRLADIERKKAEEYRLKLEASSKDDGDEKLKTVYEAAKLEKRNKRLEAEKQKVIKEKKRADSEMAKAEEQRNLAEANRKLAEEEKLRAENLSRQLEEASEKIKELQKKINELVHSETLKTSKLEEENKKLKAEKEKLTKERKRANSELAKAEEQRKLAEANRKLAEDERHRAEDLSRQLLEASERIEELQKKINELVHSETSKLEEGNKKLKAEKEKVAKERKRANSELAKAEEQRMLAEANKKLAEEEKHRSEILSGQLVEAGEKIEKLQKKINELVHSSESLGGNPNKTNSKMNKGSRFDKSSGVGGETQLALEYSKSKEATNRVEFVRQTAIGEKKHAGSQMLKSQVHRELEDLNGKKVIEEKCCAEQLSRHIEEDRRRIDALQKQIHELLSPKKSVEASAALCEKDLNAETGEMKLLKKKLKFEKMQVKHVKQVAKLEKNRNNILQQELGRMKVDYVQFLRRLNLLDKCFSSNAEGIDNLGEGKVRDCSDREILKFTETVEVEPFQMYLQSENKHLKPCYPAIDDSGPQRQTQTLRCIAPLPSLSGGNCSESMSGIDSKDSKLESLLGGSSRKMLQSSAINSNSASFSDGTLAGSQERGAVSVTTSSEMVEGSLNAQPTNFSMPDQVNRVRCNGNLAVVAENSVRGPLGIGGVRSVNGPSRKRKRILDAIESVKFLNSEGGKFHLQMEDKLSNLHDVFNRQVDKSIEEANYSVPNLPDNFRDEQFHKRKVSHEENIAIQHLCDSDELKKTEKSDGEVHAYARVSAQASQPAIDGLGTTQTYAEDITDLVPRDPDIMANFEEVVNQDYMKLLDLDNPADEECYRKAMEMPLSPTLPEIEFEDTDIFDMEKFEPLAEESLHNSLLNMNERHVDSFNIQGNNGNGFHSTVEAGKSCSFQAQDSGVAVVILNMKDSDAISRIFCATKTCMARCSLVTQTEWAMQKILLALKMEENLLSKEKACVFFSLLLLNFTTAALGKSGNYPNRDLILCLDSFTRHADEVMSDAEARSVFDELCLVELLSLIENFLMDGRVVTYTDGSSKTLTECDSKINILLDGVNTLLSPEAASGNQLVAGSIILASLCAATNNIGFMCEASYNTFQMRKCDSALVLTILHIFAYLGGERFFISRKDNLTITVMKSVVTCLEKGSLSVAATPCLLSASEVGAVFHPCTECPFSKDAVSVDTAMSLLLEKLQSYAQSGTMNNLSHTDQGEQSCRELDCVLDMNSIRNNCEMPAFRSESAINMTLCHITDVLSLVELIACTMGWDWACTTIVPELLKLLEIPMSGCFTVAIIVLLGQLGRLGIDARGYDDKEVDSLRTKLSAFLCWDTSIRAGLPVQIATITALLGLTSLDFERVVQNGAEQLPAIAAQSVPADHIRRWFFALSKEHQAWSSSILHGSVITKHRTIT